MGKKEKEEKRKQRKKQEGKRKLKNIVAQSFEPRPLDGIKH